MRFFGAVLVVLLMFISFEKNSFAAPADYPLDICAVDGVLLGSKGEKVVYMYRGTIVHLCHKGCISAFNKNPQKYIQRVKNPSGYKKEIEKAKEEAAKAKAEAKRKAEQKAKEEAEAKAKAEAEKKAKDEGVSVAKTESGKTEA